MKQNKYSAQNTHLRKQKREKPKETQEKMKKKRSLKKEEKERNLLIHKGFRGMPPTKHTERLITTAKKV